MWLWSYQKNGVGFMTILFMALLTEKFRLGMKWKSMIVNVSKEGRSDQSFQEKIKFVTILLAKWLIQEFGFKTKSKYVILGVWRERYGTNFQKKKKKCHYKLMILKNLRKSTRKLRLHSCYWFLVQETSRH
jgi:hypothetical protein